MSYNAESGFTVMGSAGSKYGIIDDGLPLKQKPKSNSMDTLNKETSKKHLKNILPVLEKKKISQSK